MNPQVAHSEGNLVDKRAKSSSSSSINEEITERLYVATHPTRLEIILRLENEKLYATKLEEIMKIDRKIVSFHLSALEKAGLVTSEFALRNETNKDRRPMAVKYYELTPEGKRMAEKLKSVLLAR